MVLFKIQVEGSKFTFRMNCAFPLIFTFFIKFSNLINF